MVRRAAATPYVDLTQQDIGDIVMASRGNIKEKQVDPRKIVGTIHVKKYLADIKINGTVESWIAVIKKLTAAREEGLDSPALSAEEAEALAECKKQTKAYVNGDASSILKKKIAESSDELKNLKDVSSSMKFKFSRYAYEAVTHVINLMTRELIVFLCDSCASQSAKLTKTAHFPWGSLQDKMMAGLYMNTLAVYHQVHPAAEVDEEAADEEAHEEPSEDNIASDMEAMNVAPNKTPKPRLSQFISNTFKEIVSRDERFTGLLLGKEITALVNSIVYEVLDRYANVIKSLLQTANSKTVNERLALIATKILLQDHMHSSDDDVKVVLDVVQDRLTVLKDLPETDESETEDQP